MTPKSKSITPKDAQALLASANQAGALSGPVMDMMVNNLNDSATALAAAQGVDPTQLSSEAVIGTIVGDASGSMDEVSDEVRMALVETFEAVKESKSAASVTFSTITFDEHVNVMFANQSVESLGDKDVADYRTGGRTALYDAVSDAITGALTYEEQLLATGRSTKVIIVVYSDGADNASRRATANDIRKMITDIVGKRENWIFAFIGFHTFEERENKVDFTAVATAMGFHPGNIREVDLKGDIYDRRHQIRQLFRLVSQSIIRHSQTTVQVAGAADSFFTQV
jgi:uncharacterized protein YegL